MNANTLMVMLCCGHYMNCGTTECLNTVLYHNDNHAEYRIHIVRAITSVCACFILLVSYAYLDCHVSLVFNFYLVSCCTILSSPVLYTCLYMWLGIELLLKKKVLSKENYCMSSAGFKPRIHLSLTFSCTNTVSEIKALQLMAITACTRALPL